MIKRKLVMACLFVLAVQLARVCLLADTKDQQMTLAEEIPDGTEVSVSGTVEWVREKEKITAVCLRKNQVRYAGTILKESKLVVCIRPDQLKEQLNIGDKVIAEGEKESFDAARNPGNFDQKEYYRKQGIHVKVRADTLEKQSEKSLLYDRIKNEMWKWRKKLSGQLQTKMGSYYGGTMSAILLGEKSGLDEEMRKLYQKNGMGHLLAISGLHMSLIGMGLYSFLRKAGTSFFTAGMAGSSFLLLDLQAAREWNCKSEGMDYVCNANGSRNNWKRIRCTDRTGGSRSMDLPETAVVSDRCGIFTFFWCNFGDNSDRTGVCGGKSGEGKEGAGKEAGFPERTFSKFCSEYGTDGTGTLVLL